MAGEDRQDFSDPALSLDFRLAERGFRQLERLAQQARDLLHFLEARAQAAQLPPAGPDGPGKDGAETLVDIGAGYYVRGRTDPNGPLLVNVGLNVFVEMDQEEASRHAEEVLRELDAQITALERSVDE